MRRTEPEESELFFGSGEEMKIVSCWFRFLLLPYYYDDKLVIVMKFILCVVNWKLHINFLLGCLMLCPTCNNTRPPRDDDDRKLKKQTIRNDVLSSFAVFFYYYITLCIVGFLLLFFQCLLCAFCGVTIISSNLIVVVLLQ